MKWGRWGRVRFYFHCEPGTILSSTGSALAEDSNTRDDSMADDDAMANGMGVNDSCDEVGWVRPMWRPNATVKRPVTRDGPFL